MRNNAAPQPLSKCFEIFVIPGSVSIPAGGSGFVNLMIKMNLDAPFEITFSNTFSQLV